MSYPKRMLKIETPQDKAMTYVLHVSDAIVESSKSLANKAYWKGIIVPKHVKLTTDQRNPLKKYY